MISTQNLVLNILEASKIGRMHIWEIYEKAQLQKYEFFSHIFYLHEIGSIIMSPNGHVFNRAYKIDRVVLPLKKYFTFQICYHQIRKIMPPTSPHRVRVILVKKQKKAFQRKVYDVINVLQGLSLLKYRSHDPIQIKLPAKKFTIQMLDALENALKKERLFRDYLEFKIKMNKYLISNHLSLKIQSQKQKQLSQIAQLSEEQSVDCFASPQVHEFINNIQK